MLELSRIKETAVLAAMEAGKYALANMGKLTEVSRKRGFTDLVTNVDKKCEEMILAKIKSAFPDHSILAEETGAEDNAGEYTWVIDPVDGTTNYAHSFPFFCTSIGVMKAGRIVVAAVYDPSRDELFSAIEGEGAFLNDKRIKVSVISDMNDSLIATGFPYDVTKKLATLPDLYAIMKHVQAVRRAGSAALDLCYTACGRFDGYWEYMLNPWDTAAGQLIVKEAGGNVTLLSGAPYDIFKKELIATNGRIHSEMLRLLNLAAK